MKRFRNALMGAALALGAMGVGSAASATTLVSDVGVYNWNSAVVGTTSYVSTGIFFNNDRSFLVFCVDLEHHIGITHYAQPLVYQEGLLTYDGAGNAISVATSNKIGRLADYGRYLVATNATDLGNRLSAVQAAIWSLEYNQTASFSGSLAYLNANVAQHLLVADNGRGRAHALIAHAPGANQPGVQDMTTGGVPEPAAWALMIAGFGLAGASLRQRRKLAA